MGLNYGSMTHDSLSVTANSYQSFNQIRDQSIRHSHYCKLSSMQMSNNYRSRQYINVSAQANYSRSKYTIIIAHPSNPINLQFAQIQVNPSPEPTDHIQLPELPASQTIPHPPNNPISKPCTRSPHNPAISPLLRALSITKDPGTVCVERKKLLGSQPKRPPLLSSP